METVAREQGYECTVEKASLGARNIVVGNPERAKVLCTAHYDTCAVLPFPNFIMPKNFLIYLLYQLLLVAVFFVVASAIVFCTGIVMALVGIESGLAANLTVAVHI